MCWVLQPYLILAHICLPGQNWQKLALDVSSFNTQTCQGKWICGIFRLYLKHAQHKCQEIWLPGRDRRRRFRTSASQQVVRLFLFVSEMISHVWSWWVKLRQTVLVIDLLSVWFKSVHMHSRSDRFLGSLFYDYLHCLERSIILH